MEGKPGTARHEWVIAITDHVVVDVTQIRRVYRKGLLRHPNPLGSLEDGELRVPDEVGFDESSVPCGIAGSRWQRVGTVIVGRTRRGPVDDVAKTRAEPGIIRSVLGKDLKVEMRSEIEQTLESYSAETLVARTRTRDGNAYVRQIGGWSLAHHRVPTEALHAEFSCAEGLAAGEECRVGVPPVGHVRISVGRTEYRRGQPRTVIERVAHPLHADLVVSDLAKNVAIVNRDEVEQLVAPATSRQGQPTLFRDEAVQFELSDFHVEPGTVEQVVEAGIHRFEVESSRLVRGRNQQERDVLLQRAASQNVQSAKIESCGRQAGLAAGGIGGYFVDALAAPERRHAQRDRPVPRVLPDGSVFVVHQLVAVVFEFLAEVIEHGPGFVAGGTTKPILAREGRKGVRGLAAAQDHEGDH